MVGSPRPGAPPFARNAGADESKAFPDPGELKSNLGGGTSPHTRGRVSVSLPGTNYPPEGAYPIDVISDVNLAPNTTGTVISIPVPAGLTFRIEGIGFGAYDPIAVSFLSWSLLVGGQPFRAYANQSAGIGNVRDCRDIVFVVRDETVVTLALSSSIDAPVTYRFVARVRGWLFSETTGG